MTSGGHATPCPGAARLLSADCANAAFAKGKLSNIATVRLAERKRNSSRTRSSAQGQRLARPECSRHAVGRPQAERRIAAPDDAIDQ